MKYLCLLLVLVCLNGNAVEKMTGKYGRDYFVQLPEGFDANKKYWLFVLVHGAGGTGEKTIGGANKYSFKDQCITVAPSFPNSPKSGGYYQILGGNADKQLIEIFKALGKKYKLHDRMILWGFSGGSQFTHRFAMKHHKYVLACSSHSGGSWGKVSSSASYLPMAISCGEQDTKKSVSSSPMGRLDWFRSFRNDMIKRKMFFIEQVRAGEGHGAGPWCREVTEKLFSLATTGLFPSQKAAFDEEYSKLKASGQGALSRLRSFSPPKLKYTFKAVDDTDVTQQKKYKKTVNEYGFTTSSKSEKFLKERYLYYLKEVLTQE